ncbi:hypothetical protein [Paenibacillus sp. 481]|uniref:hypothetical protein n=1 Tax=Paenibacillus sp. 481 TaxID=2835869 RepID=UPI001E2ADAE1|nr:hypothetical protein [Paenibacillus sp. 481]UHA74984.1 hypothetical protein KIK04_08130 [Paenibacillus sp. 481]
MVGSIHYNHKFQKDQSYAGLFGSKGDYMKRKDMYTALFIFVVILALNLFGVNIFIKAFIIVGLFSGLLIWSESKNRKAVIIFVLQLNLVFAAFLITEVYLIEDHSIMVWELFRIIVYTGLFYFVYFINKDKLRSVEKKD